MSYRFGRSPFALRAPSDIIPFSRFIMTTITIIFYFIFIIRNRPCLIRIHKKRRRAADVIHLNARGGRCGFPICMIRLLK